MYTACIDSKHRANCGDCRTGPSDRRVAVGTYASLQGGNLAIEHPCSFVQSRALIAMPKQSHRRPSRKRAIQAALGQLGWQASGKEVVALLASRQIAVSEGLVSKVKVENLKQSEQVKLHGARCIELPSGIANSGKQD